MRTRSKRLLGIRLLGILAGCACGVGYVQAVPGDPDTAFDSNGSNTTNFAQVSSFAESRGVVIQRVGVNTGRIVVGAGYQDGFNDHFAVLRMNSDGTLDTGFGSGGLTKTVVGDTDILNDIAVQSDDKIIAAGFANVGSSSYMVVARYTANGLLDTTYDTDGIALVQVAVGQFNRGLGVTVQSDNKAVVVGYCGNSGPPTGRDVCLARLNVDGSLDTTFDTDGRVRIALGTQQDQAYDVVMDGTKIVISGNTRNGTVGCNFATIDQYFSTFMRFNANGSLDTTFSGDGIATFQIAPAGINCRSEVLRGMTIATNGDYIGTGGAATTMDGSTNAKLNVSLIRVTNTGTQVFSTWTNISPTSGFLSDIAEEVKEQSDGKIVVAAFNDTGDPSGNTNQNFAALRFSSAGVLDNTWDGDGKRVIDFGQNDSLDAMVLDSSGRMVMVGYSYIIGVFDDPNVAILRLTTTGTNDNTFSGDGSFFQPLTGGSIERASGVGVQTSGKYVVAGTTDTGADYQFGLARYNTNGSLDSSFDSDGLFVTGTAANEEGRGMLVQPDDKIVVVGDSYSSPPNMTVARVNLNGGLDASFSGDGIAQVSLGTNASSGAAVARASNGALVVVGAASNSAAEWNFAIARFTAAGALDTSFNGTGSRIINVASGAVDQAQAVAIQTDGKILIGGYAFNSGASDFCLIRLNADGSNDNTFSGDSLVRTAFSANQFSRSEIRGLAIDGDGKITAIGKHNDGAAGGSNNVFALARYLPNGTLDTSFDGDGLKTSNFAADRFDEGFAVGMQFDEKPVVFGATQQLFITNNDFALARYNWDDGSIDTTYGTSAGYSILAVTSPSDQAQGGIVLSGGRQVAAGTSGGTDFGIARFLGDVAPTPAGTPNLVDASDSGRFNNDDITNDNTPTFSGTCVVGETAVLLLNGVETAPLRSRHLCRSTTYTVTAAQAVPDGVRSFRVREINGFGAATDSAALSVTIDTVALAPSITAPAAGVTLSIPPPPTISGGAAEGDADVDIVEGASPVCTDRSDLVGPANWSCVTTLGSGTHNIQARQTDIAGNVSPLTAMRTFTLKVPTVTTASNTTNPTVFGQQATFNATVATVPTNYEPIAGSVAFSIDGSVAATVALSTGNASYSTTALTVGSHPLGVAFVENGNFYASTAAPALANHVVNKADTSMQLVSTDTTTVFGESVTFTATRGVVLPGAGTPTGDIAFVIDGGPPQNVTPLLGVATLTTTTLAVGTHTVTANYAGDGNFNSSTFNLVGDQVVSKADTTLDVISSGTPTVVVGDSITFTATIGVVLPGAGTPSGTVAFVDGATPITGCEAVALATGTALCTPTLAAGVHSIDANYSGDGSFNISTDNVAQTVAPRAPSSPLLDTASDTGSSNSDNITRAAVPQFLGTCDSGDSIQLRDGASDVGTAQVCSAGTFAIGVALAEGDYTLAARATANSVDSAPSAAGPQVTIDRTEPATPMLTSATGLVPPDPIITGSDAELGANLTVYAAPGYLLCGVNPVLIAGNWQCNASLVDGGDYELTTRQIDVAGNLSQERKFTITVDRIFWNGYDGP